MRSAEGVRESPERRMRGEKNRKNAGRRKKGGSLGLGGTAAAYVSPAMPGLRRDRIAPGREDLSGMSGKTEDGRAALVHEVRQEASG